MCIGNLVKHTTTIIILSMLAFFARSIEVCETLRSTAPKDWSSASITSCRLNALNQGDINLYVSTFYDELFYLEAVLDEGKTSTKITAGLLDSTALDSYTLKYQQTLAAIEPHAQGGNLKALELMYEILSGDGTFIGPLGPYKNMLEIGKVPHYEPFDRLLDDDRAFLYLKKLVNRNEKKYLVKLADAYFGGIGTEQNWGKGMAALENSLIQYDNHAAASNLANKIINIGGAANQNLDFLAVGRALINYSLYLGEREPSLSLLDADTSLLISASVRGYSKEKLADETMITMSDALYQRLIDRDFVALKHVISTIVKVTDASGM